IDETSLGFGITRYAPALKLAQEWLATSDRPRRGALLITDFQKVAFEGVADVAFPEGAMLRWVDLSTPQAANAAITGLTLDRDFGEGRERVRAAARLANKGAVAFPDARVS